MTSLCPKYESNTPGVPMLAPKDYTTTAPTTSESVSIDLTAAGFKRCRWIEIILAIGTVAGTSIAATVKESTDNSTFTQLVDSAGTNVAFASTTTANDNLVRRVIIDRQAVLKRYLRVDFTFTAITASPLAMVARASGVQDPAALVGTDVDMLAV